MWTCVIVVEIQHNFNSINFSHVRREANQVAHYLVKYAIFISFDVVLIEETPSYIDAVVTFDLMQETYENKYKFNLMPHSDKWIWGSCRKTK